MERELVLFVPLARQDNRRARVVIQVLEDSEDDTLAPGTCREPLVGELEEICGALMMRHYNLEDGIDPDDDDIEP